MGKLDGRVAIITPQFARQAQFVILAEIKKWVRRSPVLRKWLEVLADRVRVKGYGDEWAALALPATEPDRIEGLHSEYGFFLVMDETKGISDEVFVAMQGARTGGGENRILLASTPGPPLGFYYNTFSRGGDGWNLHHISSEDSSLVTPTWCRQREQEWGGRESPLFQTRVCGNFVSSMTTGLYRLEWILVQASV